uniref:acid phosphatase n=1 Tax=Meloidogyne enterolobii TaxID=390850 RepID=A0A6V7V6T7_MELEN|nr:unnamed protein product [Meloidogyne enterolobii]
MILINLQICFLYFVGLFSFNSLLLFSNGYPITHNFEKDQLLFVQTIWRHGDRSPIYIYPNDPNKESAWPNGFGELTTRGMAQHFHLGKFLGNRYIDELQFLSPHYRSEEIFVISTDTNRTIQSATANMMGMYGGRGRCGIDYPNLVEWPAPFVPIPIHSYEFMKDPMGYARHHCKRTLDLFALLEQTPEYKQLNRSSAALLSKISEYAGSSITLNNLWGFIETVNIEKTHGLRSPDWVLQILPKALEVDMRLTDLQIGLRMASFKNINFQIEIPRMIGGSFLWEIIERMEKKAINNRFGSDPYSDTKVEGKECEWLERLKYYAHSAHDMSISALFSTLQFDYTDFDRDGLPGYASCVLIELWRNVERGYYIKVLYRRDNVDNLINLTPYIRGCNGQECSLELFKQRSLIFKPLPNQETLCKTPLSQNIWNSSSMRIFRNKNPIFNYSLIIILFFILNKINF